MKKNKKRLDYFSMQNSFITKPTKPKKIKVKFKSNFKFNTMSESIYDDGEIPKGKEIEGIIVGANIKPLASSSVRIEDEHADCAIVERWAVFIHVKLPDDKQIDLAWNLNDVIYIDDVMIDDNRISTKNVFPIKIRKSKPTIQYVLRACGVEEWVDLVNTHVFIEMSPRNNYKSINEEYLLYPSIRPANDCISYPVDWCKILKADEIWQNN